MTPEKFFHKYEVALASQKWDVVEPLIHQDACVTFSDGTFKGKSEVRKAFERTFSLIKEEKYAISDLYWLKQEANFAVCLYIYHWSGVIQGKEASGSGRGTSVLLKENGEWQLLPEHLGPNPA